MRVYERTKGLPDNFRPFKSLSGRPKQVPQLEIKADRLFGSYYTVIRRAALGRVFRRHIPLIQPLHFLSPC